MFKCSGKGKSRKCKKTNSRSRSRSRSRSKPRSRSRSKPRSRSRSTSRSRPRSRPRSRAAAAPSRPAAAPKNYLQQGFEFQNMLRKANIQPYVPSKFSQTEDLRNQEELRKLNYLLEMRKKSGILNRLPDESTQDARLRRRGFESLKGLEQRQNRYMAKDPTYQQLDVYASRGGKSKKYRTNKINKSKRRTTKKKRRS